MSRKGESLSSETTYTLRIPLKKKREKTPDTPIIRKQPIQEPVNTRKRAKENTLPYAEKVVLVSIISLKGNRRLRMWNLNLLDH